MTTQSDFLKTKEILEATGITHQVLYRYVTLGLIEEHESVGHGNRRFPRETIAAIKLIQRLNQSGYTLRDIKEIFFKDKRLRHIRRPDTGAGGRSRRSVASGVRKSKKKSS